MKTLAIRCAKLDPMLAFYSEAFGAKFAPIDVGGVTCHFGDALGLTLKLVPLREGTDFEGFPNHQPGFAVADVEAIIRIAIQHGGRQEGEILRRDGKVHAAVRDPDGNTIELMQAAPASEPKLTFIAVYERGPKWEEGVPVDGQPEIADHAQYMVKLHREGRLRDGGPFSDSSGGVTVLRARDATEATEILADDPAVRRGTMKVGLLKSWNPIDWERFGRR